MVTAEAVLDAVRRLTWQMGGPPSSGDVAAQLDVEQRQVQRVTRDLVASGAVARVGSGPAIRLVLVGEASAENDVVRRLARAVLMRRPADELEAFALAVLQEDAHD